MLAKIILWFQIRALETMVDARDSLRPYIQDQLTMANMDLAQDTTLSELRRLKREYAK